MRHLHRQLDNCQRVKTDLNPGSTVEKLIGNLHLRIVIIFLSEQTTVSSQIEIRIRINMSDPHFKLQNVPIFHGKIS